MGKPKARGNGQGTAIKRGKTWQAKVVVGWRWDDDKQKMQEIRKTKDGFATKRDALAYCAILKQGFSRPEKSPTLEHYWNAYKRTSLLHLSDSKQTAYKIAWEKLSSIKDRQISSISVTELKDLVQKKATSYYTARDLKVLLNHLYKLAGADRWVDKSLPEYIELPALQERERVPFTNEEQTALWKLYEEGYSDAAIPIIMIYTGMMTGELRLLTTDMIDFDNKRISGVGMKTKVRKESFILIPSVIIPVLQDLTKDKTGLIYDCTKHIFYDRYYAALNKAGCRKLSPYSCRHTTATALAIDENIAPQTIKKIMRWTSTKMLDRYAHPNTDDLKAAIESIGTRK